MVWQENERKTYHLDLSKYLRVIVARVCDAGSTVIIAIEIDLHFRGRLSNDKLSMLDFGFISIKVIDRIQI